MTPDDHRTGLLFRDVRLIDGGGGEPLEHHDVLVEGGVVRAVSPTGTEPPAGHRVIDGAGATLLPGFVDCHVHLSTSPETAALDDITEAESAKTLRAVPHLARTLAAGVTTVRDLAGADSGFRDALERGVVPGPRLLIALRILSITGGHGDSRTLTGTPLDVGPGAGRIADSPAGFVRLVREVVREGADWIKIAATGGVGSPRSTPEGGGLSEEEMAAVVGEARRHGLAGVAAHAIGARGIEAAARAGVTTIEHGYLIDERGIEQMLENRTVLVPTLSTLLRPLAAGAPPWAAEKRRRLREEGFERVSAAIAAGVPIAMGTDAGIVAHGDNLRELAHLVDAGLSPLEALTAGTSAAAAACGLGADAGRVTPGSRADLVLTHLDPLADIAGLARPGGVTAVYQAGVEIDRRGAS